MKTQVRTLLITGAAGIVFFISGCMGAVRKPQCTSDVSPVPYWTQYVEMLEGYYVGIGQAEFCEEGLAFQRQLARKRALSQLIQNIRVTVESSLELTVSQETRSDGEPSVHRITNRHLRVASELTLNEVMDAGAYVDATCTVWVRLKIRRDFADNLIALKQAKGFYRLSYEDQEATPAQKLRWITEARVRLDDVDFSALPKDAGNKNYLAELFAKRKAELERSASSETVWLLSTPTFLRLALSSTLRSLADTQGATYVDAACHEAHECLNLAREHGGKNLVWVKAEGTITSGALGMFQGALRLGIARFDTDTGALLSSQSDEGRVFAFDEDGVDWPSLALKLLENASMKKVLE